MLTRKHFREAATFIATLPEKDRLSAAKGYAAIAYRSNPRFQWELFVKDCNLPIGGKQK